MPGFEFDGSAPANGRHRMARPGTYGSWVPAFPRPRPAPGDLAGYPSLYLGQPDPDRPAKPDRSTKVAVTVAALIAAVSFTVVISANSGGAGVRPRSGSGPMAESLFPSPVFPPVTMAGQDFTPYNAGSTRGITQLQGRVASSGDEVVAVGAETGQQVPRAQFLVSLNGGRSWALGTVTAADGGTPPPGTAARFVAGGRGKWVAIGPGSIWTSANGRSWTLTAAGLPERRGDQITVLKRTSSGFIAAGANVPVGSRASATPVVFLSANGKKWTRLGAARLRLPAGDGRVLGIRLAAVEGNQIVIAGDVATAAGSTVGCAWLSDDGGRTWALVQVPAGHGAQPEFTDAVAIPGGFLLVRPAVVAGVPAADVYLSGNGTAWRFAATLTAPGGFTPSLMNSAPGGAVLSGVSGGQLTAFVSADGIHWRPTGAFGSATSDAVSGVAVTSAGAVIAAGSAVAVPGSSQRLVTVDDATGGVRSTSLTAIPGAVEPQLAANAVAAYGGAEVVVGGANGFPAAWLSTDAGATWHQATGLATAVMDKRGIAQLTSVTHGAAGWLAVGGAARNTPLVVVSATGQAWSAAADSAAFAGAGLVTTQAAASGDRYVIVGDQAGATSGGETAAAAWWSSGLTGWHQADLGTDGTGGDGTDGNGASQMLAVTATTKGFVAAGSSGAHPAVWTSPDGESWRRAILPLPPGATTAVLQHAAASGGTIVAAGTARTAAGPVPFAVQSSDGGATWHESSLPRPAAAHLTALAAAGGGFAATGTYGTSPGHQDIVIWTSADGRSWTEATPPGRGFGGPGIQAITGLTVSGDELTGVGFTANPADEEPTLWRARVR